jgi:predicted nucleic acid-binding protein
MTMFIDTGALVALINKGDQFHMWAKNIVSELVPPFYTCEAVLTEAHFLLANIYHSVQDLHAFVEEDGVICDFSYQENHTDVNRIIEKYHDLPASFADACLVTMYMNDPDSRIFTLDRHFHIYRAGRKKIQVISPF